MIFASDLDRTLIYSRKLIEDNDNEIILVERHDGKEISFMRKKALQMLKNLSPEILFVPVTTRTIDQYKRIFIMEEYIKPMYAITSNGGNILVNGEVDKQWREEINRKVSKLVHHEIVKERFLSCFTNTSWIKKMIFRDNLFYSLHFEDKALVNFKELQNFIAWAEENKWKVSLQSRKLYIVPKAVNKWDAVLYIKNKENKTKVVSAGDSYLDYPILINSDYSICPSHGELKELLCSNKLKKAHITMTDSVGISASEEIVGIVGKLA